MRRVLAAIVVAVGAPLAAGFPNCDQVSVGLTPLGDLGQGLYLGQFQGGLYPGGVNTPPAAHAAEGLALYRAVVPARGRRGDSRRPRRRRHGRHP